MYENEEKPSTPLIVTGLSGAGMSSALKSLEDLGYEVFDNFPLSLASELVSDPASAGKPVAIGIDTRSRGFTPEALADIVERLEARLLFLTADPAVLQRRFTETRRKHPLAKDRPVQDGIDAETEWLAPLRAAAGTVIDTSDLSIHDLRRQLERAYSLKTPAGRLTVTLMSFAYRHGLPREADMVFDARFLRNPHWDGGLRPLTGQDPAVREYIAADEAYAPFVRGIEELLEPLLPRYAEEGKSYLTVAFGCSGGKHRSVALAEGFRTWAQTRGLNVTVIHRDMPKAPGPL